MYSSPIILPWTSKQNLPSMHWHHITQHIIMIFTNGKRNDRLSIYLNLSTFIQPLKFVRAWVRLCRQPQSINQECTYHIGTATSIHNHTASLPLNMTSCMEQVVSLILMIFLLQLHIKSTPSNQQVSLYWFFNAPITTVFQFWHLTTITFIIAFLFISHYLTISHSHYSFIWTFF